MKYPRHSAFDHSRSHPGEHGRQPATASWDCGSHYFQRCGGM